MSMKRLIVNTISNYSITHNVLIIDKLSLGDYGCVTSLKLEKQ